MRQVNKGIGTAILVAAMLGTACESSSTQLPEHGVQAQEVIPAGHLLVHDMSEQFDLVIPEIEVARLDLTIVAMDIHPDLAEIVRRLPDEMVLNLMGEVYVAFNGLKDGDTDPLEDAFRIQGSGAGCNFDNPQIQEALSGIDGFEVDEDDVDMGWSTDSELTTAVSQDGVRELFGVAVNSRADGEVVSFTGESGGTPVADVAAGLMSGGTTTSSTGTDTSSSSFGSKVMEWVVEKAVETGVGKILTEIAGKTVASPLKNTYSFLKLNAKLMAGASAQEIEAMGLQAGEEKGAIYKEAAEAIAAVKTAGEEYVTAKTEFDAAKSDFAARKAADEANSTPATKEALRKAQEKVTQTAETLGKKAKNLEVAKARLEAVKEKAAALGEEQKKGQSGTTEPKDQLEPDNDAIVEEMLQLPFMASMRKVLAQQGMYLTKKDAMAALESGPDLGPYSYPPPDIGNPPEEPPSGWEQEIEDRLPIVPPQVDFGEDWFGGTFCGQSMQPVLEIDPCIAAICNFDGENGPDPTPGPGGGPPTPQPLPVEPPDVPEPPEG